jgi:hypothetical protein
LAYIKLAWGGPVEQAAEIAAGNPHAKDWQDEALKILEKTVRCFFKDFKLQDGAQYNEIDGRILQNLSICFTHAYDI